MNTPWMSFLANHLWQSTAFAAAAGLLTLAFRGDRAPVRYSLWLAASLKFLIPLSLLVTAVGSLTPPAAPSLAHSAVLPVLDQISRPFVPAPAVPSRPSRAPAPDVLPRLLFGVWLAGVGFNLSGWTRQWRRIRAAVRQGRPLPLDTPIPVISTRAGLEPGVFGIFRPVLVLPEGIVERLAPGQLAAVLVHEMTHVRRRDNLFAGIHMLVEAI